MVRDTISEMYLHDNDKRKMSTPLIPFLSISDLFYCIHFPVGVLTVCSNRRVIYGRGGRGEWGYGVWDGRRGDFTVLVRPIFILTFSPDFLI